MATIKKDDLIHNKLNYKGVEAQIHFDSDRMAFMGLINNDDETEFFMATNVTQLKEAYELAAMKHKEWLRLAGLIDQEINGLTELLESGEAMLNFKPLDPDKYIGMVIKKALAVADGASFLVQETQNITES